MSLAELEYPLETLFLSGFYILNETFVKKRKLMNIKKLQFLIRIIMQNTLFIKQMKFMLIKDNVNLTKLIQSNLDNVFDLTTHENLKTICVKVNNLNNMKFDNILYELHHKCNYLKNDGNICKFQTFNGFHQCKRHMKKKFIREHEIIKSTDLPKSILYLIIEYELVSY